MEGMPYTVGRWLVKEGQEEAFVTAWKELGAYFLSLPHPPSGVGTLVQSTDNPRLFFSFGYWGSLEDIQAMRADPRTPAMIHRLAELCEEAAPGTYRWVAEVGG
jgi:heme-degrading monooxygenase HmoA